MLKINTIVVAIAVAFIGSEVAAQEPKSKVSNNTAKSVLAIAESTGKASTLTQKDVDILLASKALNFDGLRFDELRFDYANFSLGSYRGTYFNKCNLSSITAQRDKLQISPDFNLLKIEAGTSSNMNFILWRIKDFEFINMLVESSEFNNCLFESELAGKTNLNTVTFNKVNFNGNNTDYNFSGIVQRNTTYQGCRFTNVKQKGGINFIVTYANCVIDSGEWNGIAFNNTQAIQSRITGGVFTNLRIIAGDYTSIIIEPSGLTKPQFLGANWANTDFKRATINAWFQADSKLYGTSNFTGTNFSESIFEGCTFGDAKQTAKTSMQNANFSKCEFRNKTRFIRCNLTGATFPQDLTNVEFIECIGR